MKSMILPSHYRPDIDGLRALAVLLVVSYHYFQVRGGYIGVDIFFVISGYLISYQIFSDLDTHSFSLTVFYAKRIRRIFPPLVLMILTTLVAGWFLLLPTDFQSLGKHAAAGISNVANLLLWTESGYFDAPSGHKPFLHLWSLGIEEQFYLTWPIALILLNKLNRARLPILIGLTLLSFVLNVIATTQDHNTAFYMPVTRFWELAAGGILAYCTLHHQDLLSRLLGRRVSHGIANYAFQIGLFMILMGVLLVDKQSAYPGYWALMPVLGTCLILYGQPGCVSKAQILANRPLVFIGQISYGIYLWHWPVLVVMHLSDLTSGLAKFLALVLSVLLAYASYRLVELPFKAIAVTRNSAVRFIVGGAIATVSITAAGLLFSTGLIERKWDHELIRASYQQPATGCAFDASGGQALDVRAFDTCLVIRHPGKPVVFLLGDSHAFGLYQGLDTYLDAHQVNLVSLPAMYCTPLSLVDKRPACDGYNAWLKKEINALAPDLVVIFAHHMMWAEDENYGESAAYPDYLWAEAEQLKNMGIKQVMILGQIPTWIDTLPHNLNLNFLRKGLPVPQRTWIGVSPDSLKMDEAMRAARTSQGVHYVSLRQALCNEQGCLTHVGQVYPEDLLVHDYGHLTQHGAQYLAEHVVGEQLLSLLPPSVNVPRD